MKEIRIVEFMIFNVRSAEREVEHLVNKGWMIVAAGGGGMLPSYCVILQRETAVIKEGKAS